MEARELVLTSVCGALYASVGFATFFGIFAPVFGVVRFWPAVIVPGLFALIFGPRVAATGGAIGIFISDFLIHGDALLSLTVGVPSNFLGYYVLGLIANRRQLGGSRLRLLSIVAWLVSSLSFAYFYFVLLEQPVDLTGSLVSALVSVAMFLPLAWGMVKGEDVYLRFGLASAVGLGLASTYIGLGVWAYSQIFALPPAVMGGQPKLPIFAAILLGFWTYCTEIPFLVAIVPPLHKAVIGAIPSLRGEGT